MRTKKRPAAFRQGRFGACEARLYEFRGRSDSSSSEEERIARFAADSIYEGLVYLKRREPDFEVMSVQCVGLITLPSGWTANRILARSRMSWPQRLGESIYGLALTLTPIPRTPMAENPTSSGVGAQRLSMWS